MPSTIIIIFAELGNSIENSSYVANHDLSVLTIPLLAILVNMLFIKVFLIKRIAGMRGSDRLRVLQK